MDKFELEKKFLSVFANIPLGLRTNTIAIIDKQPMTWYVVWLEVDQHTDMSKRILKYLRELEII